MMKKTAAEAGLSPNLAKETLKPSAFLNPVPVVMCSAEHAGISDIITVAWCGTVNSDPPMISVSVRKSRFSYDLIKNSGKVCVNLVSEALLGACDLCGVKSGRDVDKFAATGLTPVSSPIHGIPMIGEAPVNLECSVDRVIELGSHDMFLLNVDGVYVSRSIIDAGGKADLKKARLVAYCHGEYYALGKILGFFGYSVAGADALARRTRR